MRLSILLFVVKETRPGLARCRGKGGWDERPPTRSLHLPPDDRSGAQCGHRGVGSGTFGEEEDEPISSWLKSGVTYLRGGTSGPAYSLGRSGEL